MATHLGLDATVCHRTITAAQLGSDPLAALDRSPGVAGLRAVAKSLARRGVKRELIRTLEAAIDQFAELVRQSGGSHAKLQRRLALIREQAAHEGAPVNDGEAEAHRRRMFQATAGWLGSRLDTHGYITIERPAPDQPDHVEGAKVSAFLGHRARSPSLPLVVATQYRSGEPIRRPDEPPHPPGSIDPPDTPVLMGDLSSSPPQFVSAHTDEHSQVQIIDRALMGTGPLDAVVFSRTPRVRDPRFCNVPLFTVIGRVEQPCAQIVSDVWLERTLAGGIPDACMAWVGEPVRGGQGVPWYLRLPGAVGIELLSPHSPHSAEGWPRQAETTRRAFDMLGWSMADFVGYRIRATFPAWGAAAVIVFDYSSTPRAQA